MSGFKLLSIFLMVELELQLQARLQSRLQLHHQSNLQRFPSLQLQARLQSRLQLHHQSNLQRHHQLNLQPSALYLHQQFLQRFPSRLYPLLQSQETVLISVTRIKEHFFLLKVKNGESQYETCEELAKMRDNKKKRICQKEKKSRNGYGPASVHCRVTCSEWRNQECSS